jgi:hypothetical protein
MLSQFLTPKISTFDPLDLAGYANTSFLTPKMPTFKMSCFGVQLSKYLLDLVLELGWLCHPGRPTFKMYIFGH